MSSNAARDLTHVRLEGRPTLTAIGGGARIVRCQPDEPADALASFPRQVLSMAGLSAHLYREGPLRRRVPACLRAVGAQTEREALHSIARHPDALERAVDALVIGVTAFFRDPDVFEALARRVIPALARSVNPIRVWSAGCASGAELYSVAVLLAQAGLLSRCTLLGTDCRPSAIALARSGIVDDAELAALPDRPRAACFEAASDGRWRPVAAIRDRIRWKVADVTRGLEAGPWDLILWRNVAIYLRTDTAGALREALANSLCSGGFLVTGRAESMPQLRRVARGVYRSAGGDDGW